jgi:hypothetical protein
VSEHRPNCTCDHCCNLRLMKTLADTRMELSTPTKEWIEDRDAWKRKAEALAEAWSKCGHEDSCDCRRDALAAFQTNKGDKGE